MATIAVAPRLLRNYTIEIGANAYQAATETVLFTPATSIQTWTGGDAVTHQDATPSTWQCTAGYMQDWLTAGSLGQFLLENEGQVLAAVFRPTAGDGPTFTSTLTIVPGSIGGNNGTWPTTSAVMPCTKPVLVTETAAPAITSITPAGQSVGEVIIVQGFGFTGATSVTVDAIAANFVVQSSTSLAVVIPAGAAGAADVIVTTPNGASPAVSYTVV